MHVCTHAMGVWRIVCGRQTTVSLVLSFHLYMGFRIELRFSVLARWFSLPTQLICRPLYYILSNSSRIFSSRKCDIRILILLLLFMVLGFKSRTLCTLENPSIITAWPFLSYFLLRALFFSLLFSGQSLVELGLGSTYCRAGDDLELLILCLESAGATGVLPHIWSLLSLL